MKLLTIVISLGLVGCATVETAYRPVSTSVNEPPLGAIITIDVGEKMLTQGVFIQHDGILVREAFKPAWAYTINPGTYLKTGDGKGMEFFFPRGGPDGGSVDKSFIADPWKSVMVRADGELCVVTVFNASACAPNAPFERKTFSIITDRTFQQTLIYSGKVGNKINIGYREFTSDMARAAFNNNVEYDLSESNVIGYRGAEIEVIEATNRFIKYKVLRNFTGAR